MSTLRLLTLNIWANNGTSYAPWTERKRLIRAGLKKESPDVVAFQEVLRPQGPGTSQADELAEGLGYRVAYSRACQIQRPFPSEFGNALLSRFPLREHRTEALPVPPGVEPRSLLYALLSVQVGVLPVFVTHLSWEPQHQAVRAQQIQFIKDYIAAEVAALTERVPEHVRVLPPVLLGDLNAGPDSAEVRLFAEGSLFTDAWAAAHGSDDGEGYTFAASNPFTRKHGQGINERIDYVLIGASSGVLDKPCVLEIARAAVCMNESEGPVGREIFPSDHYGVVVDVQIAEQERPARALPI